MVLRLPGFFEATREDCMATKTIRVTIVGDHPWTGRAGIIESLPSGDFQVLNVFGADMLKVKLDDEDHECYAEKRNLKIMHPIAQEQASDGEAT